MSSKKPLGEILIETGKITQEQLDKALAYQKENQCQFGEALINMDLVSIDDIYMAMTKQFNFPYIELNHILIDQDVVKLLTREDVYKHKVIPFRHEEGNILHVAVSPPFEPAFIARLEQKTRKSIKIAFSPPEQIKTALKKYYPRTLSHEERFSQLVQIGVELCKERNLNSLLEKILTQARIFTNAEGGSLYIRDGEELIFMVAQNEKMFSKTSTGRFSFKGKRLPLNNKSLAGYACLSGKIVNIKDSYKVSSDAPYKMDHSFDKANSYVTQSMLAVPLQESGGEPLGVLALINARSPEGKMTIFPKEDEPLILSLASQAAVAVRNAQLDMELKDAYLDTIFRLSKAAECRDNDTANHLRRISYYSCILARQLGFSNDYVENIRYASPMHDVGKIGVADSILLKPGKLTNEEYEAMKQHTVYGAQILEDSKSEILKLSEEIALTHHEKFDGTGYPKGIEGENIPWSGRIVALADVFDALVSNRCYKEAWPIEEVIKHIKELSGKHFDPKVVEAFEQSLEKILEVKEKFAPQTN